MQIPYAIAHLQLPEHLVCVGMWAPHDFAQHGAAMREGAASSSWLIHDYLTGEPHSPVLMYTFYVALGKLAGAMGVDFQAAYFFAEVLARGSSLVSIHVFCAAVLPTSHQRRLAFVLVTFSSGIGALLILGARISGTALRMPPAELNQPEVSTGAITRCGNS